MANFVENIVIVYLVYLVISFQTVCVWTLHPKGKFAQTSLMGLAKYM